MKPSYYNIRIPLKNKNVLFNTLTLNFFVIPDNIDSDIFRLLKNPNCSWGHLESIKSQLLDKRFIIPNEINECNEIQKQILNNKNSSHYTLMLLPTYSCNLSCWYCVQKHNTSIMSKRLTTAVKLHISNYLETNKIKSFEIHWFGGEPMLCFESHIIEISKFAIDLCNKLGIIFFNNITTNGTLLNKKRIKLMKELHFMQFQITVDGPQDIHNTIRNSNGKPTFNVITNQINNIIEELPEAQVYLRYNFTAENYIHINKLIKELNIVFNKEKRNKIQISPVKVWQEERKNLPNNCFEEIYEQFKTAGYKLANVDMCHDFTKCIADMKHSFVIFPNGLVDKCNNINPQEARYELLRNGDIVKRKNFINDFLQNALPNACIKCRFYPACLGPCWILKKYSFNTFRSIKCMDSVANISIQERIQNFCILNLIESRIL